MDFIQALKERNEKFKLSVNQREYEKLKLGDYFILSDLKEKFRDAISKREKNLVKKYLLDIIQLQTKEQIIPKKLIDGLRSIAEIYSNNILDAQAVMLIPPPKSPIPNQKQENKKDRWDFQGRYVAQWIDNFARFYHWSLEEILNLDITVATYLFQEIRVNEQFDREWQYGLTELAYQDKDGSGKRIFVPLKRPYWMNEHVDGILPKARIRKDMLPSGHIIDYSGMGVMSSNVEETTQENQE
jgi:hypothetical protein